MNNRVAVIVKGYTYKEENDVYNPIIIHHYVNNKDYSLHAAHTPLPNRCARTGYK